jgi:hypothetical protein
MSDDEGKRTQDTYTWRRMVWPYMLTTYSDGGMEVEVRDAICPRCRAKAKVTNVGDRVLVQCLRCNISENYSPYGSYEELKDHVATLILGELESKA